MEKVVIKISEISILPVKPVDGLLGWASLVLNHQFYVGNLAIHSRPNGDIRLTFPEKVLPNGRRICCFHPITQEAGGIILAAVAEKYDRLARDSAR